MMRIRDCSICLTLLAAPALPCGFANAAGAEDVSGARHVDAYGYSNCIQLENKHARVILGPHCGGRVLEYSWKGKNAIYLDPAQNGAICDPQTPGPGPTGGRFDIGPEHAIPPHPALWAGPWQAEITGPRSARLTSVEDGPTGVQLIRDFRLDSETSHLSCTQTIRNVSQETKPWCHWSRTLAQPGGICVIPLTSDRRFPNGYVMYEPNQVLDFRPEDANVRMRGRYLEILGLPRFPKLTMDSRAGWFCYLMKNDLMFVKRFPVYADRHYNDLSAAPICIYYVSAFCELEPIGPNENLRPGQSALFTEEWWLTPYDFPRSANDLNLDSVEKAALKTMQ
ncbi:MAG: hypothetical protein NTW86_16595 [Candidatus Sumerlaeota bacterium]|nr:hypothetical protein [Candidatus Sumerlaeota bacterium]